MCRTVSGWKHSSTKAKLTGAKLKKGDIYKGKFRFEATIDRKRGFILF